MNKLILGLLGSLLLCFSSTLAHTDEAFNTVRKDISKNVKALGSNESKLGLLIEDVNVEPNQSFCVQVTTENFQEVLGMQFTLSYDPSALEFLSIGNFGVEGLNENAFGLPNQHSQIDEGTITCAWATPQLQAIELEDGSALFELCFLAKNPSNSSIEVWDFPTAIEFSDVTEHILNFSGNDSDINVAVDASVSNGIEVGMAEITLDSRSVNKGEMICLPVKAEEFNNIIGMQFSIDYDPNLLEFKSIGDINLVGLNGSYFGTPESSANIEEGTITLSWDSPGVTPISMAEGSDLFELCFEAKSSGEAMVTFSEGPTPTEFIDFRNLSLNHKLTDGQVTVAETASSLEGFSLDLSDQNVQNVNDEVCLDVTAQGFMDIIGMQFSINYDPTALEFKSVGNFNLPSLSQATFGLPDPVGNLAAGNITLAWLEPSLTPTSVTDGDAIFQMCFTALSESTSQIAFSSTPTNIEVTNGAEQNVPFNSTPANIVVGDGGDGGNNGGGDGGNNGGDGGNNGGDGGNNGGDGGNNGGDGGNNGGDGGTNIEGFALIMPDQVIEPATEFCVPVTVQDFDNIIGMQFSMSYDPTKLTFASVGEFNLPSLAESTFGLPTGNNIPDGTITLAWLEPSLNPITIADGDTIFNVCFTPTFTTGTTDIDFTNTPTSIEITNGAEQNVPATTVGSTVSFEGDPGGGNEEGFRLTIADKSVRSGNQVCLPVTVQDFDNIIGMQFSISYDPAELEFVSVGEFNLSGLSAATFGLPTGGTSPGTITLAWLEPALAPVTLMDGDTIFEVCFNALAANGTTSEVDFSGTPTAIEITNSDEQNVPFNGESGTVTISDEAVGENAVTLSIESKDVSVGEFCLDVTSTDFNDIIGLQFTIDYDPAALTFVRMDNFGLAGLDANQFANPSPGKITLTWVDQDLSGETLPDSTTVFSICFSTIATSGSTMVSFSGTPTAIEVTQTDGNNEVAVDLTAVNSTVNISNVQPPEILEQATITDEICAGDNNGAIDVTVQGGTGSFTYAWSFQNETTEDLTGLPAGTYDLTVTDVNSSLTATRSFTVNGPASPVTIDNININNPQCSGDNTGAIIVTASGGTGNLSYSWNSGLPPGSSQVNLSPSSNYRVSVSDENGCNVVSDAIEIISPDPLQATYSVSDVSCSGSNDGSISVNASGGTGNYTFSWSGGLSGDGNSQDNLGEGDYFVTITDDNGCTFASPSISITNPNPIIVSIGSFTDIEDGSNSGALVINVAGGSGSYTYSWSGPGNFNASTRSIQNLANAGEYCVTVTDGSNCSIEECFNVYEALTFDDILLNNTCSGVSGGSIELMIAGGEAPYNYNWSNGGNTSLVTGLAQGSYNVTVTDQRGVEIKGTFEINELDALMIDGSIVEVTGNPLNSNGGVNLAISGGRPGYTINWSNGSNSQALTNVTTGQYCVTVTDENNCTIEDCFEVTYRPEPLSVTPRFDNVSCFGEDDGNLFLIIQGGATPYKITFSDGEEVENTNGLVNRLNIGGGEIGYVVEDGVGEVIEGSVLIQEPDSLQVVDIAITHDLEGESCTGVIDLTIQGGTPGYIVNWNSPNTGARIIGLCAGEYVPMIEDANGCTVDVDPITVNEFAVSGLISAADCEDSRNGSIALSVSGGEGPYEYSWSNESGEVISTEQSPGELLPGAYTVTVTETSGNQIIKNFVVDATSNIDVEVEVLSNFNGFTVSCANATDGMIRAQGVNGEGNYAYEWMRGNVMVSTTSTLENAAPGVYEVIAIDENGCVATMEVELSAPPAFNVSSSVTDVTCSGERDGEILLVPAGGIGSSYSYLWNNNLPARNIQRNLAAGTYVVTVTDENNCSEEFTYDVIEPAPLSITVQADSATERFNGEVRIIASGGTQPYSYFWEQIPTETSNSVSELQPGRYMVLVRDANGCDITGIGEVKNRISPCLSARIIITPNGDGQNDAFQIACSDLLVNNNLKIYNRWGQLVFEADNYLDDWEGTTSNGSDLPDGPYFYVLEYDDPSMNQRVQIEGSITLLREQ